MNRNQFLNEMLYNSFLVEKFKDFEENQEYFKSYDKKTCVIKLQDLILEEIEKMNEETFDIELILFWFKNILQDFYFEDVYLLFHSKFNEIIKEKARKLGVEIEPYTTYMSELLSDESYVSKFEICIEKYLSYANYYMSNDRFEKYVFAVNMRKDMKEKTFAFIFNMILDRGYKINDVEYREFFLRFGLFSMKEFGLKNNYISYKKDIPGDARYILEKDKNGNRKNKILLKTKEIKADNVLQNLVSLFHEIKHGVQVEEMASLYRLGVIKQLEDQILRMYLGDAYYETNYHVCSAETDAIISSNILLSEFLKIYAPITYKREKDKLNSLFEDMCKKYNDDQRVIANISDDLQKIFSNLLQSHPEIINGGIKEEWKAVLLQIYNEDCTPKTSDHYFREKDKLLIELNTCPLEDEDKLMEIKQKIDFYDAILLTFEYSIENMKRNFLALDKYESDNPDIMAEALLYKNKIIDKLIDYGYGTTTKTSEKRVIQ